MKMKRIKDLLKCIISVILIISMVGCGTYTPPVESPDSPSAPESGSGGEGDGGDEVTGEGEKPFTVTLTYNGIPFAPSEDEEVYAIWSDGFTLHRSKVGTDAKASVGGLDGDYTVTLSSTPEGYTYNPNIYTATNDARDVSIELIRLGTYKGSGADLYEKIITITRLNMYRAKLDSESDVVYFEFAPTQEGEYSIESWMDVTSGQYNPTVEIYGGSVAYKYYMETVDDGGISSGYTKNFKFTVKLTKDMIGNVYAFGIKVTSKDSRYPAYVDFALTRNGSFEPPNSYDRTMVIPQQIGNALPFKEASGVFTWANTIVNGNRQLDGSIWGLNPDTGVYQMYNPDTGKYDGAVLYAMISKPCLYLDTAINEIEAKGNSYLTVSDGKENYKLFIEGYESLAAIEYLGYENYRGINGYANYCNPDGAIAVTEELKDFLQKLSISQLYFRDGNGWCEKHDQYPTDSTEEDQWLFACGYYLN